MVKQSDIAARLGVSQAWVARALGDDPRVSEEARQRVRDTASQLGYRPNAAAQALVNGRTNVVAVWSRHHLPVYTRYIQHLQVIVNAAGAQVLIRDALRDPGEWNWPTDGIICIDAPHRVREHIGNGLGASTPIVGLGVLESEDVDQVVIDLEVGTSQALSSLVRRGCRNIAYVLPEHILAQPGDGRNVAYQRLVTAWQTTPQLVVAADMTVAASYAAVRSHVREHGAPDGILVFVSSMVMGVMRALGEFGLQVPGDVALATVDDSPELPYFTPSLSAVEMPIELAAAEAWRLLRYRQDNPEAARQRVSLPTRFIQRESSV